MEQTISPPKSRRLLLYTTLFIIALLVMSALVVFFYQNASAAENITGNILRISKFSSLRADISILKGEIAMSTDYQTNPNDLSRAAVTVYKVDPQKRGVFKSDIVFNTSDIYPSVQYSHMRELIQLIDRMYIPGLEQYTSYKMLRPVLFNKQAAHLDIHSYTKAYVPKFDSKTQNELYDMLNKAMIVHSYNWRISRSRIGPTRYSIGFRKEQILALVDRLKVLDPHTNYDTIREIIDKTDGWEKEIVIIDIDSHGRLTEIKAYLPIIPKTTMDLHMPKMFMFPLLSNVKEKVYTYFYGKKNRGPLEVVRIKIHSLNNASTIKPPKRPVELMPIISQFQRELTVTPAATPSATPSIKHMPKLPVKLSITPSVIPSAVNTRPPGKGPANKLP